MMIKAFYLVLLLLLPFGYAGGLSAHQFNTDLKSRFLESINQARARGCKCGNTYMPPASPLNWNSNLAGSAGEHAFDMASNNYFSHESPDGRTLKDRLFSVGYTFKGFQSYTIGENIAAGQQSIDEVMDGWLKSPGHCKNLMNPAFREVGVAEYHNYWVQDFGGRVPFANRNAIRVF